MLLLALLMTVGQVRAGEQVAEALTVDVTPEGFDNVAGIVPTLFPSAIDVPAQTGAIDLFEGVSLGYSITGLSAAVVVNSARITPEEGRLHVDADLDIHVNDADNPFTLALGGTYYTDLCEGYITEFPVAVAMDIGLAVVTPEDGAPFVDATVSEIEATYGLDGSNVHFDEDCILWELNALLVSDTGYPYPLYDLLIGQLTAPLTATIAELGPTVETTLEDALAGTVISQDMDLAGGTIHLDLAPGAISITPAGMRLTLSGGAAPVSPGECVAAYDAGPLERTASAPPDFGTAPKGVATPFGAGISVSDDFVNEALYAVWRSGVQCLAISDAGGLTLDTSILGMLTGGVYDPLFPEAVPLTLRTLPRVSPYARFDGDHGVTLDLEDFDLEMYAEVDGRQARVVTAAVAGPVGADLAFDGAAGTLGLLVDVDPTLFVTSVAYNELYPEQTATVEASLATALPGLLATAVEGLTGGLSIAVPGMNGLGVQSLETGGAGANKDWLGIYAQIGTVTYATGSGCDGGCGGEGCGGGCASGGPGLVGMMAPLLVALTLRRRG